MYIIAYRPPHCLRNNRQNKIPCLLDVILTLQIQIQDIIKKKTILSIIIKYTKVLNFRGYR